MLFDIFCKVIDNHGDVGVCWRLSAELAARGHEARLWIDDPTALRWMAPAGHERVQCIRWTRTPPDVEPGDVVIEAFGCDPPDAFVAAMAARTQDTGRQPAWVNLEYLSAEPYVERSHGLPSPVTQGPGAGLTKYFFYPGFTRNTGGLLREEHLVQEQARFNRNGWLARMGLHPGDTLLVSLFCYEPPGLHQLVSQLARGSHATMLLVTEGRPKAVVQQLMGGVQQLGKLHVHYMPLLSQADYDHLLWASDFNFVRGEDSWVRALWAGRPFAWQAYPQQDGTHHAKVQAWLDWLQPGDALHLFHRVWNGMSDQNLPALDVKGWAETAELARRRALALPELATGLLQHIGRAATI